MATDAVGLESLIRRDPDRASLRNDIAVLYMELNRPSDAVPHFEASLKLTPGSAAAHFNYGTALGGDRPVRGSCRAVPAGARVAAWLRRSRITTWGPRSSNWDVSQPALASFRDAARVDPQLAEAHLNVGLISRSLGDFAEAISRFRRVLELNPDWVTAISSLASLLAAAPEPSVRNPAEAVRLADRAVALTLRRNANTLDVLAVAHAAAGDFDRAIAIADEALGLAPPAALARDDPVASTIVRARRSLRFRSLKKGRVSNTRPALRSTSYRLPPTS